MKAIEITIGIIFIFLVVSLVATVLMEMLTMFADRRGKTMDRYLAQILGDSAYAAFKANPLYQQLLVDAKKYPAYISAERFAEIITYMVPIAQKVENASGELPSELDLYKNSSLLASLKVLVQRADATEAEVKKNIERWYNENMDALSTSFHEQTKKWLLAIGLSLSVIFNINSLNVLAALIQNPDSSEKLANMAQDAIASGNLNNAINALDTLNANPQKLKDSAYLQQSKLDIQELSTELENLAQNGHLTPSDIGVGWGIGANKGHKLDLLTILYYLVGYIITGMAVTLGAPFWFNLLKYILNLRQTQSVK